MSGVLFPKTEKGDRSTTAFNKNVYSEMAQALGQPTLAKAIMSEKDWRHGYSKHLYNLFEALVSCFAADKEKASNALRVALKQACSMDFEAGGNCTSLMSALAGATGGLKIKALRIQGTGQPLTELAVPYCGKSLVGEELAKQCDQWSSQGVMETDCANAIRAGAESGLADLQGRTFVVLGAGSELGPSPWLLRAGATVVAVGTRKPSRWAEMIKLARESAGTLIVPVPADQSLEGDDDIAQAAGADLLNDAPAAAAWVLGCIEDAKGPVTLGTYLYMDGEANVRITAVSDYIVDQASKLHRQDRPVSFAWLASCSTALIIPEAATLAQKSNMQLVSWWQRSFGQPQQCEPIAEGPAAGTRIYKGLEVLQGPNYALAQSMRQWRAMLLHGDGFVVSSPVTPMCRTASVCHNATMAAVLDGVAYLPPLEAYEPETCRAVMLAILISDLKETIPQLPSPAHLLERKAFHSGLWRCPFQMSSLGTSTYLLGNIVPKKSP